MKGRSALLSFFLCVSCASVSPEQHAAAVAAMPGQKALRVGVVVVGPDRRLQEAFAEPPAAPGGAAPERRVGAVYCEQALLPASLPHDAVVGALTELGAFTDVVVLPFDGRGVRSREAMVQRLQDRVWPLANEQQLDALLVVEGVRDGGLRWSDADESLLSLDTVLWWLCWPFGLLVPDREYAPDAGVVASLFRVGDAAGTPHAIDVTAMVGGRSLAPWDRAAAPLFGLVVPPVWLGDDPVAVAATVGDWSRGMLPIELVRHVKEAELPAPAAASLQVAVRDGFVHVTIDAAQEVAQAAMAGLPRGALTTPIDAAPVVLESRLEMGPTGPRHRAGGRFELAALAAGAPLLRVVVTFVSGEQCSATWDLADLERR